MLNHSFSWTVHPAAGGTPAARAAYVALTAIRFFFFFARLLVQLRIAVAAMRPAGTSDGTPVPVASAAPAGSAASSSSARRRASGAIWLDRSGARAFHVRPAGSRVPMRDATRVVSSQASTRAAQRSATDPADQASLRRRRSAARRSRRPRRRPR